MQLDGWELTLTSNPTLKPHARWNVKQIVRPVFERRNCDINASHEIKVVVNCEVNKIEKEKQNGLKIIHQERV